MMTSFYYCDQDPSGLCFLVQIRAFVHERKNEKDSGRSSKMTSSCKWPIDQLYETEVTLISFSSNFESRILTFTTARPCCFFRVPQCAWRPFISGTTMIRLLSQTLMVQ